MLSNSSELGAAFRSSLLPPETVSDLPMTIYIPSATVLFIASLSYCFCNTFFHVRSQGTDILGGALHRLRRVLVVTHSSHIVQTDGTPLARPLINERTPLLATGDGASPNPGESVSSIPCDNASFLRDVHLRTRRDAENPPPGGVLAPVVEEALTQSLGDIRVEAQLAVFPFHPMFMTLCAIKSLVMLVYIQYHFDDVPGGWSRLCICGTANAMSGLITSVLEYMTSLLLPTDKQITESAAALGEEEAKDSAFIVELLTRIGHLELEDLSTVLIQGTTFVNFAAVFLPVFCVFCIMGACLMSWALLPLWGLWAVLRHLYYKKSIILDASTSAKRAVFASSLEVLKIVLMKVCTLWLLQFTIQASLLVGFVFILEHSPSRAIEFELREHVLVLFRPWGELSSFQRVCFLSQLFF